MYEYLSEEHGGQKADADEEHRPPRGAKEYKQGSDVIPLGSLNERESLKTASCESLPSFAILR